MYTSCDSENKKIFRFEEISNLFVKYCLAYLAESQWQILMDYLIRIGQNKLIWSLLPINAKHVLEID